MIRVEEADRRSLLISFRAVGRLMRAGAPGEVPSVLVDVVHQLGGTTAPAAAAGADALPLDLSCGVGDPVLPVAPAGSRARSRMEQVLPALLEDARVALAHLGHDSRLAQQVEIDWLTGLLNRRGSNRVLHRVGEGDSVVVIDLDHFKELNDRHGHAAGDAVLAALGRLLREHGRAEDRYGRLGGEEFIGVFPGMPPDAAARAVQRLQVAWQRIAPHPVTFSAGVAPVGAGGAAAALAVADAALYAAKEAGRDRVET
ncbi:MAG: GGDEF domain-containing protein, partial [Mycobacteriales bacterium]